MGPIFKNHPPQPPPPLDRLTTLPDGILADIISLLPTKTAVTTSVLSHRWRCLWTQLNYLHLDYRHFHLQTSEFYTVVDKLLTRLTFLPTFSLYAPYPCHQHFELWLRTLCSRNVEKIDITVSGPNDSSSSSPFTLPHCVFQTQSLVSLVLNVSRLHYEFPHYIKLPYLIKLELSLCASQCEFVAKLVRSCPLVEFLSLTASESWINDDDDDDGVVIDISCRNLKFLHLNLFAGDEDAKVVIDAPKLDCFVFYEFNLASCSFITKPAAVTCGLDYYQKPRHHVVAPSRDFRCYGASHT